GRQFVIQKARHDQKVYALPFSCQLVRPGRRSLAFPKHQRNCCCQNDLLGSLFPALGDVPFLLALGDTPCGCWTFLFD
ncbi:hypothetical protein, partial [Collinsella sp. AM10-48]|uniref:hypothetical protein n=1 Tax=Collinsella sp. AM10-48 TaxID=2292022 RepID=UPI001F2F843A